MYFSSGVNVGRVKLSRKEEIMRSILLFSVAAMVLGFAGCASPSLVVAPVGPNPDGPQSAASTGWLQVFSRKIEQSDDRNQGGDGLSDWRRYSDYTIYNARGKPVQHVDNALEHYSQSPQRIALPAGRYLVKAQAKDYFWVKVPVTIESGRTTRVHLDDKWQPLPDAPKQELVTMPNGYPVGWRGESAKGTGMN
jgi:hypothetical protein